VSIHFSACFLSKGELNRPIISQYCLLACVHECVWGVLLSTFEPFDLHAALYQRNYLTVLFNFFFLAVSDKAIVDARSYRSKSDTSAFYDILNFVIM
jgi:hypothetical protein